MCVMPVYNQVDQLPDLLDKCRENMPADEFIIIDDGSTDGSSALIADTEFESIRLDTNHGAGYAMRMGAERAIESGCDVIVTIGGNGKMLPEQMNRLLDPIARDVADYVTGSRFLDGGESPNLPLFRKITIPLVVNNMVRVLYGKKLTDATNGYRAYKTQLLMDPHVRWKEPWLFHYQFEYYLYAKALKRGYRCIEVPTSMIYPDDGKDYSKIRPMIGWWELMEAWVLVGLGIK